MKRLSCTANTSVPWHKDTWRVKRRMTLYRSSHDTLKSGSNIQTSPDFLRAYAPNLFVWNSNFWKLTDPLERHVNSFKWI